MALKRYTAEKDSVITNAYMGNFQDTGEDANMGAADILEVFSIFGQINSGSVERARTLVQFPIDDIVSDRSAGTLPASGSVSFYMRLFNAPHADTLPKDYTMVIAPISGSWSEGHGLDMENYLDKAAVNWLSASSGVLWNSEGGDFYDTPRYEKYFDTGIENLEVDITPLVEMWIDDTVPNNGVGIFLSGSYEDGTLEESYYVKKFFARGTEFFYAKPIIEARWNSAKTDDRGYFYASSSLADATDNANTLYFYNIIRGRKRNIPSVGTSNIYVNLYDTDTGAPVNGTPITGGWVETGIYTASVTIATTASYLSDVWFNGSGTQFYTGSIKVHSHAASDSLTKTRYITSLKNAKSAYSREEQEVQFRLYTRLYDWSPTIYTVATTTPETSIIKEMYYKIKRFSDDNTFVDWGTGSIEYTKLSYDKEGSYFELDMSLFEVGYSYGLYLMQYDGYEYRQLENSFKFKVEE